MLNHYTTPPYCSELYSELFFCQIWVCTSEFSLGSTTCSHIYTDPHIETFALFPAAHYCQLSVWQQNQSRCGHTLSHFST